jgi:glycosyltransferase involved in cell wall biosynthesis
VAARCGWFSDRSVCYLASGRPVIAQETGFSRLLPTGAGLFAFETADEVLARIEALNSGYERAARAGSAHPGRRALRLGQGADPAARARRVHNVSWQIVTRRWKMLSERRQYGDGQKQYDPGSGYGAGYQRSLPALRGAAC